MKFHEVHSVLKPYFDEVVGFERDGLGTIHVLQRHLTALNVRIGMKERHEIVSIVRFEQLIPVTSGQSLSRLKVEVNLAWRRQGDDAYPLSFPTYVNFRRIPRNISEHKALYWVIGTDKVQLGSREVPFLQYCQKLMRKHMSPVKAVAGFPIRALRLVLFDLMSPVLLRAKDFFSAIYFLTSGSHVKFKAVEYSFDVYFSNESKVTHEVIEGRGDEVEFLGIKVKVLPVFVYSAASLSAYLIAAVTPYHLPIFEKIFENTFLTAAFVVTTYFTMFYGLSRVSISLGKLCMNLRRRILAQRTPMNSSFDTDNSGG